MDARASRFDDALQGLIGRLHARGRPRVWSLVVTVFGDAIVPHGGRAPLSLLQDLMGRLGIEAGAVRTAMSRLASDGWVERERVGRNSFFELAAGGRHAFDLATRRIYAAAPPAWDGGWTVAVAPPDTAVDGDRLIGDGFIRVASGVFLKPERTAKPETGEALSGMLVIHGSSAEHPETLSSLWPLREVARAYDELLAAWRPLAQALRERAHPAPIAAAAARTLLIHDWRRIVLRDPGLPTALLPDDWPGEDARLLVRTVYENLRPASEEWLRAAGMPSLADPESFAARFAERTSRA